MTYSAEFRKMNLTPTYQNVISGCQYRIKGGTIVEMQGDEMARVIWDVIKQKVRMSEIVLYYMSIYI
jgi:hypothetical protein